MWRLSDLLRDAREYEAQISKKSTGNVPPAAESGRSGTTSDMGVNAVSVPRYVGLIEIGGPQGIQVWMDRRPHWLARLMYRFLLDWRWRDE